MSDVSMYGSPLGARASSQEDMPAVARPWVRHYEEGVPASLVIPEQPLTWLLEQAVRAHPQQDALIYYGQRLSYARLAREVARVACALGSLGIRKGDRVALALPNIPQYPIVFYAALSVGAVVVPTNPLSTARELAIQLADAEARVLVMLDEFYPVVRTIRGQTALEHILLTSASDFLPPLTRALYPFRQWRTLRWPAFGQQQDRGVYRLRALVHASAEREADSQSLPQVTRASDLAVLQYTGGTTGLPKGAMLTHRNLLANALQTRAWLPRARVGEEVMLCAAPFFHAYGMTVGMNVSLLLSASMVLLPRFRPQEVVRSIRRYRPTLFPGIPTMYLAVAREAARHPEDLRSIKYCISGAAPLPAKVRAGFEALTGGRLVEGYGLSEAGPVTHCNPLTDACRNGSVGLPLPGVEAAIVDQQTGDPLSAGSVGEIVVRGPNVMQGYWRRKEETETALARGWLHTGDLGVVDEDGYFSVVERIKDVIIASGLKVYPREVEEVLLQHPAVLEAGVVGVPDAYRGETVVAFVVLAPGVAATADLTQALSEHCRRELAGYKVPRMIEVRSTLPKSFLGKVLHRELHPAGGAAQPPASGAP